MASLIDKLLHQGKQETETDAKMEDFFKDTDAQYDRFDATAWKKGSGYEAPRFPMLSEKIEGLDNGLYLFAAEANVGKDLALTTPILLANGQWSTMGDLKVGDSIFGDDGLPTTVIAKSEVFTDHECFNVEFGDGSVITAGAGHQWLVKSQDETDPQSMKTSIVTTKQLYKMKDRSFFVPLTKPLQYKPRKLLPVSPYVLGMFIARGVSKYGVFLLKKNDIKDHTTVLHKIGYDITDIKNTPNADIVVCHIKDRYNRDVKEKLSVKRIPEIYFRLSEQQRWNIVSGILDTLGTPSADATLYKFRIHLTNDLIGDVHYLFDSLGIKYNFQVNDKTDDGYIVTYRFTCNKQLYKMRKKISDFIVREESRPVNIIASVYPVETVKTQCIEVNNKSHCYLAGRGLTVTHNSALTMDLAFDFVTHKKNKLFGVYVSLDDSEDKIIARLIAKNAMIPISAAAKPQRYSQKIEADDPNSKNYEEYLYRRSQALNHLRGLRDRFKIIDSSKVHNGEQLIDYLEKLQKYVKAFHGDDTNLLIVIDSVSDIKWHDQRFHSQKEEADYTAREVKEWAATRLKCPIFGTIHLRKIDQNRRPCIADVKESGRWAYEADVVFLLFNDVGRNGDFAKVYAQFGENLDMVPVIEINWAKNKASSFKGHTYCYFFPNFSYCIECEAVATQYYNMSRGF